MAARVGPSLPPGLFGFSSGDPELILILGCLSRWVRGGLEGEAEGRFPD